MAVLSNDLIRQGAAGASTGYTIKNSYFNSAISRSFMTADTGGSFAGNKTFTYSWWTKKINKDSYITGNNRNVVLGAFYGSNNRYDSLQFNGDQLEFFSRSGGASASTGSSVTIFKTNRVFRDVAAWYHIVIAVDTTEAVANERVRLFVNGIRETSFDTLNLPSADTLFYSFGDGVEQNVGTFQDTDYGSSYNHIYFDGYFAEFHGLDGYAYDASYFGEFQADTDIWIPKKYDGSYGTHGYYLKFGSAGSLGTDSSGGSNDFTLRNIDSAHQTTDTPTNNMITFNSSNNQRGGGTVSEGALDYTGPSTRTNISLTANIPATGKWAVAFKATNNSNDEWNMGITKATNTNFGDAAGSNEAIGGQDNDGIQFLPSSNDASLYNYISSAAIDPSLPITTSDEFWMAVDTATGKCFLGIYDASTTSMKFVAADTGLDGNPATGDNPTITISDMIGSGEYTFAVNSKNTNVWTLLRSTEVSGTTPSGYTYFENVKDLL